MDDMFGGGGGGGAEASGVKFEIPVDFSSAATSSASGWMGNFNFGSYTDSPIKDSANSPFAGGDIDQDVGGQNPLVWVAVIAGVLIFGGVLKNGVIGRK